MRHTDAVIIWAHCGVGRIVQPIKNQVVFMEEMLEDPNLSHVNFDLSWDELAKYIVRNDSTVQGVANLINKFPDRFLFGTDEVASTDQESYFKVYKLYEPLWNALTKETSEKVRKGNYKRLFDAARVKVRAWETANKN
jgi:hypothetical protein